MALINLREPRKCNRKVKNVNLSGDARSSRRLTRLQCRNPNAKGEFGTELRWAPCDEADSIFTTNTLQKTRRSTDSYPHTLMTSRIPEVIPWRGFTQVGLSTEKNLRVSDTALALESPASSNCCALPCFPTGRSPILRPLQWVTQRFPSSRFLNFSGRSLSSERIF